jgi:hypothetical protein
LQRETTLNILLRLELIEQTVKLISSKNKEKPYNSSDNMNKNGSTEGLSRNLSAEKIQGGRDSLDYMAAIGGRRR